MMPNITIPTRNKRRGFTLIEIMVCLLLIGSVASWVGFKMVRFIREQEFEHGIATLVTTLRSAQVIAMASGADIRVDLNKNQKKSRCVFYALEPALENIDGKEIIFGEDVVFSWNDKKSSRQQLTIYSSGRIEPTGVLGLHFGEEKETRKTFLDLRRPLLIKLLEEYPKNFNN